MLTGCTLHDLQRAKDDDIGALKAIDEAYVLYFVYETESEPFASILSLHSAPSLPPSQPLRPLVTSILHAAQPFLLRH